LTKNAGSATLVMTHPKLQRRIAHLTLLGLDMIAVGLVELEAQPAKRTHIVARLTDDPMALRQ
jgi:hypothetical protein